MGPKIMAVQNPNEVFVREAVPADSQAIARIYNHYVTQTVVTFEKWVLSSTGGSMSGIGNVSCSDRNPLVA